MLNRRILRIKAFKAVYSLAENPDASLKEILSQLDRSCEATRDLYLFILDLIPAICSEAEQRIEAARRKFNPTDEEKNPNLRFAQNRIAGILSNDPDFQKIISKKKMSWDQYDVLLRHIYDSMHSSAYYERYMALPECRLQDDAAVLADFLAAELPGNEELGAILEELDIWWNDDLEYALNCVIDTLRSLGEGKGWALPELYQSEGDSDRDFVMGVVTKAVAGFDKYWEMIAQAAPKWDRDRICTTDLALIVCGASEHAAFPDMPTKIIINEYVEISKFYSTPESRSFVNGLLDRLINKQ